MTDPSPPVPMRMGPEWCWDQAFLLIGEVIARKDEENFTDTSADLLFKAAQTYLLAGLLAERLGFTGGG